MLIPDALPVLSKGHHQVGSGKACVMDAISWLSGRPEEGDAPSCVHPVLRVVAMQANDTLPDSERHKLWALVPRLIGTAPDGPPESRVVLSVRLAAWCAGQVLPLVRERDRAVCLRAIKAAEGWCEGRVSASAASFASTSAAAEVEADADAYAATFAAAYAAAAASAPSYAATISFASSAASYAASAASVGLDLLLEGLVAEHARLTGHPEQAINAKQWADLTRLLGVAAPS